MPRLPNRLTKLAGHHMPRWLQRLALAFPLEAEPERELSLTWLSGAAAQGYEDNVHLACGKQPYTLIQGSHNSV